MRCGKMYLLLASSQSPSVGGGGGGASKGLCKLCHIADHGSDKDSSYSPSKRSFGDASADEEEVEEEEEEDAYLEVID